MIAVPKRRASRAQTLLAKNTQAQQPKGGVQAVGAARWNMMNWVYERDSRMSTVGWVALIATVVVWSAAWWGLGLAKGRSYGNKLAAHLGWKKNFFHTVLDEGTNNSSLMMLRSLGQTEVTLHQAAVFLSPYLSNGLHQLEQRFGRQPQIEEVKPHVAQLLDEHQKAQKQY